jgi:hypothetical protein
MGVDMCKCNLCEEVVHHDHTFYFEENIEIMHELLQKEEVKKYLFEDMKLNKNKTDRRVEEAQSCRHCFCDYCIKKSEIRIFYKIENHFETDKVKIEGDVFTDCYNYIIALMKIECKECNKEVKEKEAIENSKNLLQRLKAINKSKTKKEILDEIIDIIRAWTPLIIKDYKPIIN